MKNTRNIKWLSISAFIIIIDLLSKYLITQNFALYDKQPVLPFVNLMYAQNTGAAFSFLANVEYSKHAFSLLAVIVMVVLVTWLIKLPLHSKTILKLSYVCIIGGATGNLLDRLYHGFVVDFLDFYFIISGQEWHYATFNIADAAICFGAFLLIIDSIFLTKPHSK